VTSGATGVSGAPERPSNLSTGPTGVVAVQIYGGSSADPFYKSVYDDPMINGVDLAAQWCNLEPEPGVYNWTPLTDVFKGADASGKFVILTLIPGVESPSWALAGVKSIETSFTYANPIAERTLPMPWDQVYLHRWYTFLQAVADQYGTNPAFKVIEVGGPTSVSTEMSEPDWDGVTGPSGPTSDWDTALPARYHGSDLAMWRAIGYTPDKYVAAWAETFREYRKIFPDQYMALALIDGLPIANPPRFGLPSSYKAKLDFAQVTQTPLDVIAAALKYKNAAIIQTDGISPDPHRPPYPYVQASCDRAAATGFQTVVPGSMATPLGEATLQPAWEAAADFVEVYQSDVVASMSTGPTGPTTPYGAIWAAEANLPARENCDPLTLTGRPLTATPSDALPGSTLLTEVNWQDTKFNPPFPTITFKAVINIFDGKRLIEECAPGTTCTVPLGAGTHRTTVTADVGAPGTVPYTNQAVASARATILTGTSVPKPVPPNCKGAACM
jgi:hypothetical protein